MKCLKDINKKILIYGTGLDAVRCLYNLKSLNKPVVGFINKNPKIADFCGLKVYDCKKAFMKDHYVIVASMFESYIHIRQYLDEESMSEFEDYIFYQWLDKEIVFIHGNCHLVVVKEYLMSSEKFNEKYVIYPTKPIYEMKGKINKSLLENCDVWIHQQIRAENQFGYHLSDQYIKEKINPQVKEIIIPNLYSTGKILFPQIDLPNKNNFPIRNGEVIKGMFPDRDIVIDECVEGGMSVEETIEYCGSDRSLQEEEIMENYELHMKKIRERDKNCDIKIYNFINDNLRKTKLFYDPGHPTNFVIEYICIEILKQLDINIDKNIILENTMSVHESPIYPKVAKVLGLNFTDNEIRKGKRDKKLTDKMDFEEYIKQYIWYCHGKHDLNE